MSEIRVALIAVTLVSLVSGCIPIPLGGHTGLHKAIETETITFIQSGTTTREDVLLRLGAPDWAGEHRFIYGIDKRSLALVGLLPLPMSGGGLVGAELHKYRALVIEFDENSVVTAWRFGKGVIHDPSAPPTSDPTALPAWIAAGDVIVGADPYVQPLRQKALFAYPHPELFSFNLAALFPSGNLTSMGVLPIQLLVENRGARRVGVPTSSIMLELSDGRRLAPASGQAVADDLPPLHNAPFARRVLRRSYRNKELRDVTLGENQSRHGFIYFILPPDLGTREALAAGVTIEIRMTDMEEAALLVIRLLLRGQG